MSETSSHREHDDVDDPTERLEALLDEWRDRKATHEEAANEADDLEEKQRHRGQKKALQYAITWLEAGDLDEEPFDAIMNVCGHLGSAATDQPDIGQAPPALGPRQAAFKDELSELTAQSRKIRNSLQEELDRQPDIDDIMWVNDEIKQNAAEAWGFDE